ncbi:hypothetical protein FRACYDRAFT_250816 [Fragilariopsis cylindrus CCMP1102]|uniref:Uncharacterized protein n=1 Tax=Fragilariopsis cylindrus CCMP1102 TaxID=635003 RepID=A0A1E7EPA7_9STRA|nr:hypothetical protein FRACYDRAFT_250816 [Fragilariopsis cylindrus CCMP1102]|eukprot:OEU07790.1 hypothetical protein FRACYDRAFT_250816 [Fragilariopsis cylindrus CCMP1102]
MKKNINNRMKYSKTETKKMKNMNKTLKGSANVHFQDGTKTKTAIRGGVLKSRATGGLTTDARNDDASSPKSLDNGRMEDDTYYGNDMDDDIRDGIVSVKQIIEQYPQPNKQLHHHRYRGISVDDDRTRSSDNNNASRDDDDFTYSSTYDDDSTNFGIEEATGTFEDFVKQWDEESTNIDASNIDAVTDALATAVSYEDFVKNTVTDALVTTVGCDGIIDASSYDDDDDDDHEDDGEGIMMCFGAELLKHYLGLSSYSDPDKSNKKTPSQSPEKSLVADDDDNETAATTAIEVTLAATTTAIEVTLRNTTSTTMCITVSPINLSCSSYNERRRINHNNNNNNNNIGNGNGKIDIKIKELQQIQSASTTTIGMDDIAVRNPFFLLASSSSSSNYPSESNNTNHITTTTEDAAAATAVGVGSSDDSNSNNNSNKNDIKSKELPQVQSASITTVGMDDIVVRYPFFLLASSSSSSNYSLESNNDNHTKNTTTTEDAVAATVVDVGSKDDEDEEDDNLKENNNDVTNIAVGNPTSSSSSSSITDMVTGSVDSLGSSIETNNNNESKNNNSISHGGSAETQIREAEETKIAVEIYPRKQLLPVASPPTTTTTTTSEKSRSSSSPKKRNNKKRWWSRKNSRYAC